MKVYEVIRLINKKLLFIDLHYKRLYKSLEFYGVNFKMSYDEFLKELNQQFRLVVPESYHERNNKATVVYP